MTALGVPITNEHVIPVIESDLFSDRPDARFAVGIVAVGDEPIPGLEKEVEGYYDLRRRVYVEQMGHLTVDDLNEDGTDRDRDDSRSVAFGVVENRGWDQRFVASIRLIIKGAGSEDVYGEPLPVERFCPDVFEENPAPLRSLEVSRLIARHEKQAIQDILRWRIYAAALGFVANHDLGPGYGVVEGGLERNLKSTIPVTAIGDPRYIDHYNSVNSPILIDSRRFVSQMEKSHPGFLEEARENEGSMVHFGKAVAVERRNKLAPIQIDRRQDELTA